MTARCWTLSGSAAAFPKRCPVGLPQIRLHDLRHGWARMGHLGPTGVHLKVVRERLGQRTLVSCLTPTPPYCGMHEDVAEQVAAMFRTPVSNPLAETTWGAADERSDQRSHCVRGGT